MGRWKSGHRNRKATYRNVFGLPQVPQTLEEEIAELRRVAAIQPDGNISTGIEHLAASHDRLLAAARPILEHLDRNELMAHYAMSNEDQNEMWTRFEILRAALARLKESVE